MSPTFDTASLYYTYPDNDDSKDVYIAAGKDESGETVDSTDVMIFWDNSYVWCYHRDASLILSYTVSSDSSVGSEMARQIVQLQKTDSLYHYSEPNLRFHQVSTLDHYTIWPLGTFTRDQREQILELAGDVNFLPNSLRHGSYTWTKKLLAAMVDADLLDGKFFAALVQDIPLSRNQSVRELQTG
jgi:hypothetical protein